MTCYRAGMTPDGSAWQVERSSDGLRPQVIATLPTAHGARALIDSLTGELSPLRSAPDDSPRPGPSGAASSLGVTPGSSLTASSPSGDALGRSRAGRSRREVGLAAER